MTAESRQSEGRILLPISFIPILEMSSVQKREHSTISSILGMKEERKLIANQFETDYSCAVYYLPMGGDVK